VTIPIAANRARNAFHGDRAYIAELLKQPAHSSEVTAALRSKQIVTEHAMSAFKAYADVSDHEEVALLAVKRTLAKLKDELDKYFRSLPRTEETVQLIEAYITDAKRLREMDLRRHRNRLATTENQVTTQLHGLLVRLITDSEAAGGWATESRRTFLLELHDIIGREEVVLESHGSEDILLERETEISTYRSYGSLVERMLFSE
jgi:hypothetical protein